MRKIITSESVNKGHPDKTCDIIADSFLDEALKQDPHSQMAVECAIKDDLLMIYGEATTNAKINYKKIAKQTLTEIGYKNKFKFVQKISTQSPDINQAVVGKHLSANDQGMVFGYATNETKQFMPLPIIIAHQLMQEYESFRKSNSSSYFPDAKSQVSVTYKNDKPFKISTVLVSVSHAKNIDNSTIKKDVLKNVIEPVLVNYSKFDKSDIEFLINTSGKFTIWGSFGDSGCVGRKIVVDSYGGVVPVGGGCFSSKNPTKVDRSGAYFARYIAKNIVANKLADRCMVSLSFAIGVSKPINIDVECFNTNKVSMTEIKQKVLKNFNFTINDIIASLDLLKPVYKRTACYGHFGRDEFSWERVIKLE